MWKCQEFETKGKEASPFFLGHFLPGATGLSLLIPWYRLGGGGGGGGH